ncbi:MAG: DNA polymerase III subunit gamma/tau [Planctomycetaceae bacterium]|nr:DNA polymerase III subunit gamma/tau [Planctomycetaceae bacterium]
MTDSTGHYTVLARRFRPQTFEEVVGQERIGQALRNAILSGRVAHAYLFTGARGVGKTSTARIFAKALNCPHVQNAVPCNECDVCRAISAGSDVDVLEIDGASNRGIDDIRSLRANVNVKAMRSPYKVYIIDEVHMLTKEAFNALLKTLEEPPARVKFVFCTTEPHKVPDTILSRCQRFDFGTIASGSIKERLRQIAAAEGIDVADEAIDLVARRAAGSMRDSQSLFDQLLAFGGEKITSADVHQLLGTASDERLIELFDALIARRRDQALGMLDQSLSEGVQIGSFSDQLLLYLRDLLIAAAGADEVPLLSVGTIHRQRLSEQAGLWGLKTIAAAMQILAETKNRMQKVNYDRALIELAVIRISLLEDLDNIGALMASMREGAGPMASLRPPTRSPAIESASRRVESASPRPVLPPPTRSPQSLSPTPPSGNETSESPSELENSPLVVEAAPQKTVEFAESSLTEFLSEVYHLLGDRVSGHLKKASAIAISGPNALAVLFTQSYFLNKQYIERPGVLQQVQDAATRVAGRPITISLTAAASTPTSNGTSPRPTRTPVSRRKPQDLKDDFVDQAVSLFGGTVVDVREIPDRIGEE